MTSTSLAAAGPIWLVGCGNMGGAMLRGWLNEGVPASGITVIDPGGPDVPPGVTCVDALPDAAAPAVLVLAVKPQLLDAIVAQYRARSSAPAPGLLISVLAGVEEDVLRQHFATTIVRVMPNLPAQIGKGISVLHGTDADQAQRETAGALMGVLGRVEWIADEAQFHAVTALSGSGPGYVFRFIDALADAGAALGLPVDLAHRLAVETVLGSAALAQALPESPAVLADRVASPGGTTREGLNRLDADGGIRPLLKQTLEAAARRSRELAAAARERKA